MQRMTWDQICRREDCRGRWIALHRCAYDASSGRATEGDLVDADDNLADLCDRVHQSEYKHCAIVYCDA